MNGATSTTRELEERAQVRARRARAIARLAERRRAEEERRLRAAAMARHPAGGGRRVAAGGAPAPVARVRPQLEVVP